MPDKIGVHIPGAVTVNSQRYLEGLWAACQDLIAARRGSGGPDATCTQEGSGSSEPRSAAVAAAAAVCGDFQPESSHAANGSFLRLLRHTVESLEEIEGGGDCDAVIVASGAAAAAIAGVPPTLASFMDLAHVRPTPRAAVCSAGLEVSLLRRQRCHVCAERVSRETILHVCQAAVSGVMSFL